MDGDVNVVAKALTQRFLLDHPLDAAKRLEVMPVQETAPVLADFPVPAIRHVIERMSLESAATLLAHLPKNVTRDLVQELYPSKAVSILGQLESGRREFILGLLPDRVQEELREYMSYPEGSAGNLMETIFTTLREDQTVEEVLSTIRRTASDRGRRTLYAVDNENKLMSYVELEDIVLAEPGQYVRDIKKPVQAVVDVRAQRSEIVTVFEANLVPSIPVIDPFGHLIGIIRQAALVKAVGENATANLQSMVGVSRDEHALSPALFAVRKRLAWLNINLLTAFLAASVVGLFESTIATFTALAVLLPVVAGQSGNAGAQALAVTMRGLALREIGIRQWLPVVVKELKVGLINGVVIAVVCAVGVYFWSESQGLALVIFLAMIIAMIAAGLAGALVPIVLTRLGQDPATAASIILTTVTDIAGFFSFLGIATLLASMI